MVTEGSEMGTSVLLDGNGGRMTAGVRRGRRYFSESYFMVQKRQTVPKQVSEVRCRKWPILEFCFASEVLGYFWRLDRDS